MKENSSFQNLKEKLLTKDLQNETWTKIKAERMNAQKKGTKGQPRRNFVERMKNQRTSTKDKENSQTWVGKTKQLHMNEVDQCKDDGFLMDCLF